MFVPYLLAWFFHGYERVRFLIK